NVDDLRAGIRVTDRAHRRLDSGGDRDGDGRPAVIAAEGWRPHAAEPADRRGDQRLVQRRVSADDPPVPARHGCRVVGRGGGIAGVGERAGEPGWRAVVHEVEDDPKACFVGQVADHLVGPGPVEHAGYRVDPVPWQAVADGGGARVPGPGQVLAPLRQVAGQLVLV